MTKPGAGKRLDGWKVIAAYFKRDRTTVMRWANERGMPVYRLPGGRQGSVSAFEHELEAWVLHNSLDDVDPSLEGLPADGLDQLLEVGAVSRSSARRGWALAIVVVLALTMFAMALGVRAFSYSQRDVPRDAAVAADYVAARDLWGRRTAPDIARAIALLDKVITRDPRFAPGHASLAEAWLVYRE
jgi:hypothetical protein